ncbi:MAG: hypothetical protein RM347_023060 [Nostoc sp. ChiQUE02]|uniref:hypothetical protein n=1 Tax=Nostoc sp. ChiQUE02 TaxID=3075377 RepID=UPI002AD59FFD|nr:hypothetical protein [Nostoc sp. ChiQUE02]
MESLLHFQETRRQSLQRGATPLGGFADLKEVAWEPPQRAGSLIASVQDVRYQSILNSDVASA